MAYLQVSTNALKVRSLKPPGKNCGLWPENPNTFIIPIRHCFINIKTSAKKDYFLKKKPPVERS